MMDWNGNGRIDPVDVGISIATGAFSEGEEAPAGPEEQERPRPRPKGLLGWLFGEK